MAHAAKKQTAADGNRQRYANSPWRHNRGSRRTEDVNPDHIDVISQTGSTRFGWIDFAERWWSSRPDCAVWRTKACVYVYFIISEEA